MTQVHSALVLTLGGVAIFMLGMKIASENLQMIAADRIRDVVTTLARKPFWGLFLGVGLTAMLQSSGAVTSLLVGLGAAGVITLKQVMSVILGTAVGSTLTVQVLSFNVAQFGLPIFAIFFIVYFLSQKRIVRASSGAVMGFGMIFFGLEVIGFGTEQFRNNESFTSFLQTMQDNPIYTVLLTAFFTGVVHSSAVTISIAMSMASHNLISGSNGVWWVFGANIGTTATALIAAAGGGYVGRQVAWAHTLFKVLSVLIFIPLAFPMLGWIQTNSIARDLANFNTIYNLLTAVLFYPFCNWGASMVEHFFPPSAAERQYSVKYLNKKDWDSPSVTLAHAEREAMRMGDVVISMLDDSLKLFQRDDPELVESMRKRDDRADLLARELNMYLAQQIENVPDGIRKQMLRLMYFVTDLEAAADVVDNQLLELAQKKHNMKVDFSEEGWAELREMASAVNQVAQMAIACFQANDRELAAKVIFHKRNVRKLEQRMRESHMTRLVRGTPESIITSSIHLDVLGEYRRVVGLLANHVYTLMKDGDPYGLLPRKI